ncbi:SPOR domain-containing protein [Thiocystis violascens]|uniref:SPOR domain-containing protein n=1 Tax=Thiocystis violascens (strain ATCC 17096 / DSM 198 / 6111) TaxID=765911 RepID=I3YA65_THIV6|nr:hypothetical protein [Thiocystis violascens]AFL73883.1 hypothetical protein Thivi_1923 [Thiocystis violascens DSM 198]
MEHDKDLDRRNQPNQDDISSARHSKPLQPEAVKLASDPGEPNAPGRDILKHLATQAAQMARLSTSLEQQRVDLKTAESALVSRIADVDDDRRLTASQLQRTWQSHRDEMADLLKRKGAMLTGILLLFGILVAISLAYFYVRFDQNRQTLVDEVAELRHMVGQLQTQIPEGVMQSRLTQDKLSHLSIAIQSISASLDNLKNVPVAAIATPIDQPVPTEPGPAPIQEELADDVPIDEPAELQPPDLAAETEIADRGKDALTDDAPTDEPAELQPPDLAAETEIADRGKDASTDDAPTDEPAELQPPDLAAETEIADRGKDASTDDAPTDKPAVAAPPETISTPDGSSTAPDIHPTTEAITSPKPVLPLTEKEASDEPAASTASELIDVGQTPYALQLIGFFSFEELLDFARRFPLPAKVYHQEKTYRGRPWFVLIHSLHASRESANEEIARLPAELVKLAPWVRKLAPDDSLSLLKTGSN